MTRVSMRFYAELNDFLPYRRRYQATSQEVEGHPAVKDMIEALGVPHTEVDLVLANSEPVDFAYAVQDGDRISVYPVFESIDIAGVGRVRPRPLRETRFVLDVHLGKLATYLRMLGFDTLYANDYADETLARISSGERRILLTRDRGLLKRGQVTHGYYVRETKPERQVAEVLRRFDLFGSMAPFQRCLRCNGTLAPVSKDAIEDRLLPKVKALHEEFQMCQACERIYWKGTHHERMERLIEELMQGRGR